MVSKTDFVPKRSSLNGGFFLTKFGAVDIIVMEKFERFWTLEVPSMPIGMKPECSGKGTNLF